MFALILRSNLACLHRPFHACKNLACVFACIPEQVSVVRSVAHLGFHVVHSDIDVVWLRDPLPYFMEKYTLPGRVPAGCTIMNQPRACALLINRVLLAGADVWPHVLMHMTVGVDKTNMRLMLQHASHTHPQTTLCPWTPSPLRMRWEMTGLSATST